MSALCSDGTSNHPVALFFHTFSGTAAQPQERKGSPGPERQSLSARQAAEPRERLRLQFIHAFSGTKTANRFHRVSRVGGIPKRSVCDVVMGGSGFGRRRRCGMEWQRVRAMKAMRNGVAAGSGDEGDAEWAGGGFGR